MNRARAHPWWIPAAAVSSRRKPTRPESAGRLSCRTVFFEPLLEPLPAVLGRLFVVARPVVCVEAVSGFWIHNNLRRVPRRLQCRAHLLDRIERNPLIFAA